MSAAVLRPLVSEPKPICAHSHPLDFGHTFRSFLAKLWRVGGKDGEDEKEEEEEGGGEDEGEAEDGHGGDRGIHPPAEEWTGSQKRTIRNAITKGDLNMMEGSW